MYRLLFFYRLLTSCICPRRFVLLHQIDCVIHLVFYSYVLHMADWGLSSVSSNNRCRSIWTSCRRPGTFRFPLSCLLVPVFIPLFRYDLTVNASVLEHTSSSPSNFFPAFVSVMLLTSTSISSSYVYRYLAITMYW